jgi:transketolase C-terminal domain/subunit
MSLDVIFAAVVGVLAGLAVIGALVFVLVWEWYAIRRTLANHRQSTERPESSRHDHPALTTTEQRP